MLPDFSQQPVQLGLGLIGIGRPWGHRPSPVPSPAEAQRFLECVLASPVRFLDTAPSYAYSEERLGAFLKTLRPAERAGFTVATKFGENWDFETNQPAVDHSWDGLRRSLDRSLELLGAIDVLQLHKTNPQALASDDVLRAFEYARLQGVAAAGPSVSDAESAESAIASPSWQMLQMPLNLDDRRFERFVGPATGAGKWLVLNRPLAMGRLAASRSDCFGFLRALPFRGIVLMGTSSPAHLAENVAAFEAQAFEAE